MFLFHDLLYDIQITNDNFRKRVRIIFVFNYFLERELSKANNSVNVGTCCLTNKLLKLQSSFFWYTSFLCTFIVSVGKKAKKTLFWNFLLIMLINSIEMGILGREYKLNEYMQIMQRVTNHGSGKSIAEKGVATRPLFFWHLFFYLLAFVAFLFTTFW